MTRPELTSIIERIAKASPELRLDLFYALDRYCQKCGRVGKQNQTDGSHYCEYCDRNWEYGNGFEARR